MINSKDAMHEDYMRLMEYLEIYKDSICYSAQGVVPNKTYKDEEDPNIEREALTATDIWPVEQSGPKKGKIKAPLDSNGKIVVDPAGNIVLEKYLLDFDIYRANTLAKQKAIQMANDTRSGDDLSQMFVNSVENFTK